MYLAFPNEVASVEARIQRARCVGGDDDDCRFSVEGDTIVFFDVDDDVRQLVWEVWAEDEASNVSQDLCVVRVVEGDDDDDSDDDSDDSDDDSDD